MIMKKKRISSGRKKHSIRAYRINTESDRKAREKLFDWIKTNGKSIVIILMLIGVVLVLVIWDTMDYKPQMNETPTNALNELRLEQCSVDTDENVASDIIKGESMPEYLQAYLDVNRHTVGYIKIENTMIDYLVMQTDENEYYLSHNYRFEEDRSGAIFMDYRCDINDFSKTRNMILYGHRMKDGTMFKDLLKYQNQEFFRENRIITFNTINGGYQWKIFAVMEITTDFYYIETEFPYDEMWIEFLKEASERSIYDTHTNNYPNDIVLTLSTCTTEENGRLVVMAKLLQ
ncbi:MAG: class B sortase [Eubacteriales bacterium]